MGIEKKYTVPCWLLQDNQIFGSKWRTAALGVCDIVYIKTNSIASMKGSTAELCTFFPIDHAAKLFSFQF